MYETIDVQYQRKPRSILGFVQHRKSTPDWGTLIYPYIYLTRRSAFVLITFGLFRVPGIQINLFIYLSILYVIFIGHCPKFNPRTIYWTEIANEAMFLLICYHILLFSNLIWDQQVKLSVGISLIIFLVCLLGGNTLFIAVVSVRGYLSQKRIKYIKSRHSVVMQQRLSSLSLLDNASFLNRAFNEKSRPPEFKSNMDFFFFESQKIKKETKETLKSEIEAKFPETEAEK